MRSLLLLLLLATMSSIALAGDGDKDGKKPHPGLTDPSKATEKAPDKYRVKFSTTQGEFLVDIEREWAPLAADRFYNMVKIGYFQEVSFYRVVRGFIAQFGFSGDPAVNKAWTDHFMADDPVKIPNSAGTLVFANRGGRNTRTNQFFFNTESNTNLDPMGFAPFGKVVGDGLEVVKSLYAGYGERGPNQGVLNLRGNEYAKASFPNLDYIKSVTLEKTEQ